MLRRNMNCKLCDKIICTEEFYIFLKVLVILCLVDNLTVPFERAERTFCNDTGCLMIYWLRFIRAFLLDAGMQTEASTENPECFQERIFNAKRRSSSPLSTNSFITRLLKTSVRLEVSLMEIWWKEPFSSIHPSKTRQW